MFRRTKKTCAEVEVAPQINFRESSTVKKMRDGDERMCHGGQNEEHSEDFVIWTTLTVSDSHGLFQTHSDLQCDLRHCNNAEK